MNLWDRLFRKQAVPATPNEAAWETIGQALHVLLPGSKLNWAKRVGDPWLNGVASIGLKWLVQSFPEARLAVYSADGTPDYDHPLCALVRTPNPAYTEHSLIAGIVTSLACDGNAYLLKVRGRAAQAPPVELYWLQHWLVEPVSEGGMLVAGYEYRLPNGQKRRYPVEDIVHIRHGIDPSNPRRGIGPLTPLMRELASDNEAATYTAVLLSNMGVPGVIITSRTPDVDITEADAERLKLLFEERMTGDNRGRPVVIPNPIELHSPSLTPAQLGIDGIAATATARVLTAMGLSPMAVGLPDAQRTYSNYAEALRAAWQNGVLPLMALIAGALETQLLPDYMPARGTRVEFDTSEVSALQTEEIAVNAMARQNYLAGIWTRAEARAATGMPTTPEDEQYIDQIRAQTYASEERNTMSGWWIRRVEAETSALSDGDRAAA